jgi:hypothetical protein
MNLLRTIPISAAAAALLSGVLGAPASAQTTFFQTPTSTIACSLDSDAFEVRCDVKDATFAKPAVAPERITPNCGGRTLKMNRAQAAYWACSSDTQVGTGAVLPYGQTASIDGLECISKIDGVRCYNSHHSFRISRDSYEIH